MIKIFANHDNYILQHKFIRHSQSTRSKMADQQSVGRDKTPVPDVHLPAPASSGAETQDLDAVPPTVPDNFRASLLTSVEQQRIQPNASLDSNGHHTALPDYGSALRSAIETTDCLLNFIVDDVFWNHSSFSVSAVYSAGVTHQGSYGGLAWTGDDVNGTAPAVSVTPPGSYGALAWTGDEVQSTVAQHIFAGAASNCDMSDMATSTTNHRGRSRFRRATSTWKCQVRKRLRNSGMAYISRNGVARRPKLLKPGCGQKCRQRCHERISDEQREHIFHSFWQLGNLNAQRQFLLSHVIRSEVNKKLKRTKKLFLKYCFHVDGQKLPICKRFFLDTLCISDQMVHTTLTKMTSDGHLLPEERKPPASHRLPESTREAVRNHVNKFQTVPSHYCRHTSSKQYLPETLTLTEMYRMYANECAESMTTPVKKHFYFDIFHKDFNLAFHKPKKDMCDLCVKYSRSSDTEKDEMKQRMEEHSKNKTVCRELKEQEKLRAQSDSKVNVACFDLQQVLITPQSMSSQLYYRRKLATYNLTVFDVAKKDGYCYMWHEGVAKRGANSIASCVWKYMTDKAENGHCNEFVFFSDNCGGQNKNKTIAGMYLYAIRSLSVDRISHYYLEAGHTQNEGDSMHAVIERAAKRVNVFTPMQWYALARTAKKSGSHYAVTEMNGHMKDFKTLGGLYCKRLQEAVSLKSPEWHKIKAIMVEKENPHVLFVKYTHDVAGFVPFSSTTSQSVTSSASPLALEDESTISKAKKDDLLYMCNQLIIPRDYHCFYSSLPLEKQNNVPKAIPREECSRISTRSQPHQNKNMAIKRKDVTGCSSSASSHKEKCSGTSASKRNRF